MAHQCKIRYIPIDSINRIEEDTIEEIFEWALHTTYTKDGVIVNYLDENWEKQIRYFGHNEVISIHIR
jgi:hypothetical protein